MYSLFLDHSFSREILALFKDNTVVQEIVQEPSLGDQPCFFWQEMLERAECTLEQIDFFVCGTGPGSYTGMRGAAAAVKAASFVQDIPIVAVSSLLLLCPQKDGEYLLIKDAKIAGLYAQTVRIYRGTLSCSPPEVLVGDLVAEKIRNGLLPVCEESDTIAMKAGAFPTKLQSAIVAKFAYEAFLRKDVCLPENLPLSYLRKTQAEIENQLRTEKNSRRV